MTGSGAGAERFDVVIVGSGHGGAMTAASLRARGFAGSVAIVGAEVDPPYERPPLSKDYLSGDVPFERILIRPQRYWQERGIALLPGRRVTAVDAAAHRVAFADGAAIGYGTLVWAAGGDARRLTCEGGSAAGVHTVRNRPDVDRMRDELLDARHCVVIGGGYIGLEAAAVLRKFGKRVTLFEAAPRLLSRVAGPALSAFIADEHRKRGVALRLGETVAAIQTASGRARGVVTADGETVSCEMVVVGIGIVPSVEPLLAAGANGGNGVDVDETCRTSLPDVYAIGDCAAHRNVFGDGTRLRLESVQNANDQASLVGRAIVGDPEAYRSLPWFWSNQYDLRLQTAGLAIGHDVEIVRGTPASRSFSIAYLRAGRLVAVDAVNAPKDYVAARKLIEMGINPDPGTLADPAVELKSLLAPIQVA